MNTKTKNFLTIIFFFSLLLLLGTLVVVLYFSEANIFVSSLVYAFLALAFVSFFILSFFFIKANLKRIEEVQKGINHYIDEEISQSGLGMVSFSSMGKIIWISSFVKERFGKKILGKNVADYFDFKKNARDKNFVYAYIDATNGGDYEIRINLDQNMLTIKDDSFKNHIIKQYDLESIVVGEIEIDNFHLLQLTLAEDEIFNIQTCVINLLENLTKKFNLSYRQYVNGKFWIITNQSTLLEFQNKDFIFFNYIHKYSDKEIPEGKISVSGSFATGTTNILDLTEMAKRGLLHSQSRGGDQISVVAHNKKIVNYGSKVEIQPNSSRTLINNISKKIMKKIVNPEFKRVIIYGHKMADLDSLGAAYALAKFFQSYGKIVQIQNNTFDNTTKNYIENNFSSEDRALFIKPAAASKVTNRKSLIFIVDTSELNRIENPEAFERANPENIFILDHHRTSVHPDFCPRFNQYIDTSASSASEVVTEFLNFSSSNPKLRISAKVAQSLLNGIYMDTNWFQKSTSTKTFAAAALLNEWGALPQNSVDTLKMSEEISAQVKELLSTLQEVKQGYFLAYSQNELPSDVVSIAADEVLRIKGRKAAFVVAKTSKKAYKMSARGINTNVQVIAESLGGGGHFSASAVVSENETLEQFVSNIKQAIVSVKNESNNN